MSKRSSARRTRRVFNLEFKAKVAPTVVWEEALAKVTLGGQDHCAAMSVIRDASDTDQRLEVGSSQNLGPLWT